MPTLLLVDDDPQMGVIVGMLGRRAGLTVVHRTDVPRAWDWLCAPESGEPALVLLDVNLPGCTGIELCRRIKANPGGASVPVALFIGGGMAEDLAAGWAAGADHLLLKDLVTRPDDWQRRLEEIFAMSDSRPPHGLLNLSRSLPFPAGRDLAEPSAGAGLTNPRGGILGSGEHSLREWFVGVNAVVGQLGVRLPGPVVLTAVLERAVQAARAESSGERLGQGGADDWLGHREGQLVLNPGRLRVRVAALTALVESLACQARGLLGGTVSEPFLRALAEQAPALTGGRSGE